MRPGTPSAARLEHTGESMGGRGGRAPRFRGRLEVIPLGVDTAVLKPGDKPALKRRLGLHPACLCLLWMGRFSASDKADLLPLVQVFARLRHRFPRARLELVLAGSDRGIDSVFLRDFAQQLGVARHLHVLTSAPASERHLVHAAADVFVSPVDNVQETFGLTPVEAMACGVPQVVSDWDGYRDTVLHGETGFLVPTTWADCTRALDLAAPLTGGGMLDHLASAQSVAVDVAALEAALATLVQQPELRQRMGAASRRRAVRHYAWRAVLAHYDALWEELGREARRAPLSRHTGYPAPEQFEVFRGYPSRLLAPNAPLSLTPLGRAALAGTHPVAAYYAGSGIALAVLERLLTHLHRGTRTVAQLTGRSDAEPRLRHLLWLLKYGLVTEAHGDAR